MKNLQTVAFVAVATMEEEVKMMNSNKMAVAQRFVTLLSQFKHSSLKLAGDAAGMDATGVFSFTLKEDEDFWDWTWEVVLEPKADMIALCIHNRDFTYAYQFGFQDAKKAYALLVSGLSEDWKPWDVADLEANGHKHLDRRGYAIASSELMSAHVAELNVVGNPQGISVACHYDQSEGAYVRISVQGEIIGSTNHKVAEAGYSLYEINKSFAFCQNVVAQLTELGLLADAGEFLDAIGSYWWFNQNCVDRILNLVRLQGLRVEDFRAMDVAAFKALAKRLTQVRHYRLPVVKGVMRHTRENRYGRIPVGYANGAFLWCNSSDPNEYGFTSEIPVLEESLQNVQGSLLASLEIKVDDDWDGTVYALRFSGQHNGLTLEIQQNFYEDDDDSLWDVWVHHLNEDFLFEVCYYSHFGSGASAQGFGMLQHFLDADPDVFAATLKYWEHKVQC